jgi:hypothetical protein
MSDANKLSVTEVLLDKLTNMIRAQASNQPSEFSSDQLNHVYMRLVEGSVDVEANELLIKMFGAEWHEGWEPSGDDEAVQHSEAINIALTESIEEVDETDMPETVKVLAAALMVACRELGWLDASRAAHDKWFYAADET